MEQYNDRYILKKIINRNFSFHDLAPKVFPQLRHGAGLFCPFHENSRTGTMQARLYYNEDEDMFYLYCYAEGKAFTAFDYVNLILCKNKQIYTNPKEFILSKIAMNEFIALYNLYKKQKAEEAESQFKRKCRWIDNVYADTGNIVDYIEKLYTA